MRENHDSTFMWFHPTLHWLRAAIKLSNACHAQKWRDKKCLMAADGNLIWRHFMPPPRRSFYATELLRQRRMSPLQYQLLTWVYSADYLMAMAAIFDHFTEGINSYMTSAPVKPSMWTNMSKRVNFADWTGMMFQQVFCGRNIWSSPSKPPSRLLPAILIYYCFARNERPTGTAVQSA